MRELREAVRLDPKFVLAHIALAESVHTLAMRDRIRSRGILCLGSVDVGIDLEDLAQDVFVVLLRNWAALETSRPLRSYLFAVAS